MGLAAASGIARWTRRLPGLLGPLLLLSLTGCAPGPVLSPAQVKVASDAPALACLTLGVIVAEVEGGAALAETDAREAAAIEALRGVAAAQSNDTVVFDGYELRGADLHARGRAFDCAIPP